MKPIVIRGAAAEKLRNLETMCRLITGFAPSNAVEADTRTVLLTLLEIRRTQLRREAVMKLFGKETA